MAPKHKPDGSPQRPTERETLIFSDFYKYAVPTERLNSIVQVEFFFQMTFLAAMNLSASITHKGKTYRTDLSQPFDIAIPIEEGLNQVNCFYAPPVEFSPVVAGSFIGSTTQGGLVNFFNVKINPHGNGTHTECVGHIAKEKFTIRRCLTSFHFLAKLVSLYPTRQANGDRVFLREQFEEVLKPDEAEAFILRTLPNDVEKLSRNYSGTNPPYLDEAAAAYLTACGVEHFLLDLPSVDREEDGGKLLAHRAFWQYFQGTEKPEQPVRKNATITELIFVSDFIKDGLYLLNLQTASFELDVSPSKPVLYLLMIDE